MIKMTFKKKDPELVTLYFVAPGHPQGKARQYRVSKRQEFVTALQVRGGEGDALCVIGASLCFVGPVSPCIRIFRLSIRLR